MTAIAERRTLCVRIQALDGTTINVAATYPTNLVMSNGQVYKGGDYTTASTRESTTEGGATMIDFGFVDQLSGIDRDQLASGKWDDARVFLFATDWAHPVEDEEPLAQFTLGKITDVDGRFTGQLMGLTDRMNQHTGRYVTQSCIWTFCDYNLDTGIIATDKSRCELDPGDYIVTGTITHVTNSQQFRDASRSEAADWFGNGQLVFTSGGNAGLARRTVKSYAADGSMIMNSPFYYLPEVGDTYTMIAGCRKRGAEDCTAKHHNRNRFGGFSYVPTKSQVTKFGGQ